MSLSESEPGAARAARPGELERQAGSAAVANGFGLGLRFAAVALTTATLGVEAYGSFVLATTTVAVLHKLATLGLSPGLLPFVAAAARDRAPGDALRALLRAALRPAAAVGATLALGLVLFGGALAEFAFDDPRAGWMLRGLGAVVLLDGLATVALGVVQGLLGVRTQAWIERVSVPAAIVVALLVARALELGARGVVGATVAGSLVGLTLAAAALARRLPARAGTAPEGAPPPGAVRAPDARALLAASWPLLGTGLLAFVLSWMDVLVLGALRESAEVGLYGLAARLSVLTLVVHEGLGPFFLAHATQRVERRDRVGLATLYRRTALWSTWSALGLSLALAIWARPTLALFGEGFEAAAPILWLLVLGRLATAVTGMCGKALIATGRARLNLIDMLALIALNGALDLWWVPVHGAPGAAAATCVSLAAINLLQTVQVWRHRGMLPFGRATLGPLAAAVVLAPVAWAGRDGAGALGWWGPAIGFSVLWLVLSVRFGRGTP